MEHQSRAVILRTSDYGEADRIVSFFADNFGKMRGVAKNAKRSSKRFGGGFEPGSIGRLRFMEKYGVELVRLEEFAVEAPVWKVATSLEKLTSLYIALEIAEKMLPPAFISLPRFELLQRWIMFLAENEPRLIHRHAYIYKWLKLSGLEPVFDKCVVCGSKESKVWRISASQGGAVCSDCRFFPGDIVVQERDVKHLRTFKSDKMPNSGSTSVESVFKFLIEHAVGNEVKSITVANAL
jgi:DNA repair protein RecO (recombination protein O)